MAKRIIKTKPFTHAERCAGSTLSAYYVTRKGWSMQTAQQGGRPAVLTYKGGELVKARYIVGEREPLGDSELADVAKYMQWHGTRRNFRVIGQVRRGLFEAIAVIMYRDRVMLTNLADSAITPTGFYTPSMRRRMKPTKKFSKVSVVTTVYPDRVTIAWFHRERSKLLKRIKLERI